jgi:hypothetical protein
MPTFDSIQSYTISGTSTNQVTFSSFSGYTDLVLVIMGQNTSGNAYPYLQFNGDTGNNYQTYASAATTTLGAGNGYNPTNELYLSNFIGGLEATNFNWGSITHIVNYSSTSRRKTSITQAGKVVSGNAYVETSTGSWRNTSAITSIKVALQGSNIWFAGSTISLYGILAA